MTPSNPTAPSILALVDLDQQAENLVTVASNITKKLRGTLKVLHAKGPLNVIRRENQLSAKKELYEDLRTTQGQLASLVKRFSKTAAYEVVYGNVKHSILETVARMQPDIIVLGKRSKKLGGFVGDRVTDAILTSNSTASVLIVDERQPIPGSGVLSIGVLKGEEAADYGVLGALLEDNSERINYFSIEQQAQAVPVVSQEGHNHYVFSSGTNAMDNLVSYTAKTNTQLFCIPKGMQAQFPKKKLHKFKTNVLLVR